MLPLPPHAHLVNCHPCDLLCPLYMLHLWPCARLVTLVASCPPCYMLHVWPCARFVTLVASCPPCYTCGFMPALLHVTLVALRPPCYTSRLVTCYTCGLAPALLHLWLRARLVTCYTCGLVPALSNSILVALGSCFKSSYLITRKLTSVFEDPKVISSHQVPRAYSLLDNDQSGFVAFLGNVSSTLSEYGTVRVTDEAATQEEATRFITEAARGM
jgi:hypothetical protein